MGVQLEACFSLEVDSCVREKCLGFIIFILTYMLSIYTKNLNMLLDIYPLTFPFKLGHLYHIIPVYYMINPI